MAAAYAAAAVPIAATFVIPVPTAAAQPCPDVEVVFARGTSEPPGVGRVGQALADALAPQLGGLHRGHVRRQLCRQLRLPQHRGGRHRCHQPHRRDGPAVPRHPDRARRLLAGRGGRRHAWRGCRRWGTGSADIGSAPPLPGGLNGNVAAVAVFGNPAAKFGNPVSAAGSFAGKAIDLCADGDPICSDGRNPFAHTTLRVLTVRRPGGRLCRGPDLTTRGLRFRSHNRHKSV